MKRRIKINEDTMTSIVIYSLLFCVIMVVASYTIVAIKGTDTSEILSSGLKVFGTELGICALMTLQQRYYANKDKRLEAAEKERRDERENDRQERKQIREEERNCTVKNTTIINTSEEGEDI